MLTLASGPVTEVIRLISMNFFWFAGAAIAVVSVMCCTGAGVLKARAFERTRREIAAYVAEGSITPDEAERLLEARAHGDD